MSLHDVAPATAVPSSAMLEMVERRGLRCTLLVVPGPFGGAELAADDRFADWLRRAVRRGHEVALHGWEHRGVEDPLGDHRRRTKVAGQLLARGCAEFLTLGEAEAARRIELGLAAVRRAGLDPCGFTPPGWLASPGTLEALRRSSLRYTTSQWAVTSLEDGGSWRLPAVSQRPGSPLAGLAASASRIAGGAVLDRGRPLRVALHPADLGDPRLVASTSVLLDLVSERRSMTYAELVGGRPSPVAA